MQTKGTRSFTGLDGAGDVAFHRAVPLYYRLSLLMKERMRAGLWPEGTAIPGELQLCREFRTSRGTVAQAIALLVEQGLLRRRRGSGTFVERVERVSGNVKLDGPVRDYFYQGIPIRVANVARDVLSASPSVAERLGLGPGETVVRFRRLRTVSGSPLSYAVNYLPREVGLRIAPPKLRRQSLLDTLERDLGFALGPLRQTIEVAVADTEVAEALRVPLLTPTLLIQMELRTAEGRLIDVGQTYFRADRYRYTVEFPRAADPEGRRRRPTTGG